MKGLAILGATGSIGRQALEIAGDHPDRFRAVAPAARRDVEGMVAAARRHRPGLGGMRDPRAAAAVR
ncbi:MAG: 1-deoxy-D-xylulose-5-phosphate reductoisomerase, partial [Bacillota bacterium]